jgi:cytochrome P450
MALVNHPEVQDKLQKEIDAVIGRDRAPHISDIPNMKYWNAVMKEVLRWRTIAPLNLPHATSEEVTVNGYTLPKNTTIFTSLYSIHVSLQHI